MTVKNIDLKAVKAFSKEQRNWLASEIRKDQELWNAVNGFGGLSEFSEKSRLQGTVIENETVAVGKKISIANKDTKEELIAVTNQQGYYSIDLKPADYRVSLKSKDANKKSVSGTSVETIQGETSTLNFGESSNNTSNNVL